MMCRQLLTYSHLVFYQPAESPLCSAGVPVIVTININPRPRIAVITDAELCYDGPARFDVSNPNTVSPGATWFYNLSPVIYPAGVTGDWAAGLTDQTATGIAALTDNLVNNTNNVQTVTYTFTPHIRPGDGGPECSEGVPITVIVNINPRPRIAVITDAELCYDNPATFGITNPNTVHTGAIWYYDVSPVIYPAGVTGDWAAGFTDLTATGISALTDNLVNNTNDVQTVFYTFTPHIRPGDGGTECGAGVAVTVTVHINPRPRIAVAADGDICYDEPGRFDITNLNTVNAGATWYYDVSPVIYPAGVTGNWSAGLTNQTATGIAALTDNLTNTSDLVQTVIYTFIPHIKPGDGGSECRNGVQVQVIILINPRPRLYPVPPNTIQCDSTLTNIVLQSPNIFSSGLITFDQSVIGDGAITGYSATPVIGLPNNHLIADRLVNLTDEYHPVTYRIVPVSPTGCLERHSGGYNCYCESDSKGYTVKLQILNVIPQYVTEELPG